MNTFKLLLTLAFLPNLSMTAMEQEQPNKKQKTKEGITTEPDRLDTLCIKHFGTEHPTQDQKTIQALCNNQVPLHLAPAIVKQLPDIVITQYAQQFIDGLSTITDTELKTAIVERIICCNMLEQYRSELKKLCKNESTQHGVIEGLNQHDPQFQSMKLSLIKSFLIDKLLPKPTVVDHQSVITSVAWSPDGNYLATGSWNNTAKIWTKDGTCIAILTGHQSWVTSVAWSPDGNYLATGSDDNTAKIWTKEGICIATLTGHQGSIFSVAWSPDGNYLATASDDRTATIWTKKNDNWKCIATLTGHLGGVASVAWSSDGNYLATGSHDTTARIWTKKNDTWECIAMLIGHQLAIKSLAWSPDGNYLATASCDRTAKIWTKNGICITTLTGHQNIITSVSWSPDGKCIATASWDRTAKIWTKDGICITTLTGHQNIITSVAWSSNGNYVATSDRTAKIWDINLFWKINRHIFSYDAMELINAIIAAQKNGIKYQMNAETQKVFNQLGGNDQEFGAQLRLLLSPFITVFQPIAEID